MPAASSSPIDPAIGHLAALADGAGDGEPDSREVLARVAELAAIIRGHWAIENRLH
jgi:hypothetical protein